MDPKTLNQGARASFEAAWATKHVGGIDLTWSSDGPDNWETAKMWAAWRDSRAWALELAAQTVEDCKWPNWADPQDVREVFSQAVRAEKEKA